MSLHGLGTCGREFTDPLARDVVHIDPALSFQLQARLLARRYLCLPGRNDHHGRDRRPYHRVEDASGDHRPHSARSTARVRLCQRPPSIARRCNFRRQSLSGADLNHWYCDRGTGAHLDHPRRDPADATRVAWWNQPVRNATPHKYWHSKILHLKLPHAAQCPWCRRSQQEKGHV